MTHGLVPILTAMALATVLAGTSPAAAEKRYIVVTAVEPKGGASVEKEPFPATPLPEGAGYQLKKPNAEGRWEVAVYVFDPRQIFVNEGDEVTLEFVGINGASHPITIGGYDKSFELKARPVHPRHIHGRQDWHLPHRMHDASPNDGRRTQSSPPRNRPGSGPQKMDRLRMSTQRIAILALALIALAAAAATCAQEGHDAPWPSEVFNAKPQQNVAGKFDYYTLVMSWSPTHCVNAEVGRDEQQCSRFDGLRYGFVLHGLWPQYEKGYPEACRIARKPFVPQPVINSMLDIMPSGGLVIHEYKLHGTCSGLEPAEYYGLARRLFSARAHPRALQQSVRDAVHGASGGGGRVPARQSVDAPGDVRRRLLRPGQPPSRCAHLPDARRQGPAPAEATRTRASSAVPTRCMSRPYARHGARALRKKKTRCSPSAIAACRAPGCWKLRRPSRHPPRRAILWKSAQAPRPSQCRRLAGRPAAPQTCSRDSCRGVGNMRDAAARRERSDTRSAAIVAPARARQGRRGAALWTTIGFVCGAVFWHAVGFWDFVGDIVFNPERRQRGGAQSARRRSTRSKQEVCRPFIASTRQAAPAWSLIANPTGRSCAPARETAWRCGSMRATIAGIWR